MDVIKNVERLSYPRSCRRCSIEWPACSAVPFDREGDVEIEAAADLVHVLPVDLSYDEKYRLYAWMDLNSPYCRSSDSAYWQHLTERFPSRPMELGW